VREVRESEEVKGQRKTVEGENETWTHIWERNLGLRCKKYNFGEHPPPLIGL
jgi:hypothetical protein